MVYAKALSQNLGEGRREVNCLFLPTLQVGERGLNFGSKFWVFYFKLKRESSLVLILVSMMTNVTLNDEVFSIT